MQAHEQSRVRVGSCRQLRGRLEHRAREQVGGDAGFQVSYFGSLTAAGLWEEAWRAVMAKGNIWAGAMSANEGKAQRGVAQVGVVCMQVNPISCGRADFTLGCGNRR